MDSTDKFLSAKTALFPLDCLLIPAPHSLITADLCEQLQLPIQPMKLKSLPANAEDLPVLGICSVLVSMKNFNYVSFTVVSYLI